MKTGLLLHLMIQHGVDALAEGLLDGCTQAMRTGAGFAASAVRGVKHGVRAGVQAAAGVAAPVYTAPLDLGTRAA